MYQTTLGAARLLTRPGDRRLWLLDTNTAALWDLLASGWSQIALAGLLAERFGLALEAARVHIALQEAQWRQAGLLDAETPPAMRLGDTAVPVWPPPNPRPLPPETWALRVADRRLGLGVSDPDLRDTLWDWLAPATDIQEIDHVLVLTGPPAAWRLTLDGKVLERGAGRDTALVATLSTLTEVGCRPPERLIVLHGAGLVAPDGAGLLLVAPGGSGKTTLAAALDVAGYGLLSDDVVPVGLAGEFWGLGLPLCLKPGSWPVLASRRPTLAQAPTTTRYGGEVRYLPALSPRPTGPIPTATLFLSRYRPGQPPACVPLGPEAALQGIIEAEAVLRDLTQAKLDALARWIGGVPAYRLEYPDLAQALALIDAVRARPGASPPSARP